MIDLYKVNTPRRAVRLWLLMAILAAPQNVAQASNSRFDRLLAALTSPTDVSACNLLSLTDGRVVAVQTEHGLFVQTKDGPASTHYFIDPKRKQIEACHFARQHTYPPMDRPQADAKQTYYPFYGRLRGGGVARAAKTVKFICHAATAFTATSNETCPGWPTR